ncbi:MarR family winged helix-turn-helix transcriptional regulator [Luteimicrobium sp. DT211]|uniref:MarR family winged helix-turn-helix transcriptional regulator n=1 Tax=Luteimicrobium sp. DT211 TaxID=3393412 RepID=UPI003CEDDB6C
MPTPDALDDAARRLGDLVPVLNRALERGVAQDFTGARPTDAEIALLTLVVDHPGLTVREAATTLLMKPNNVSALVSQLVGRGLVERVVDGSDRRVAHLHPTSLARDESEQVRAVRAARVSAAVSRLSEGEKGALFAAIHALTSLTEHLHDAAG